MIQENTALTSQVKTNTDLLDEIHLHVANIGKKIGADMGRFPSRVDRPVGTRPPVRSPDRSTQPVRMDVAYHLPCVVPTFGQVTTRLPICVAEFIPVDVILP